jgi:hypothetical protein
MTAARYIHELAGRTLGAGADTWLNSPHPELAEPDTTTTDTPRALAESGCPACVRKITDLLLEAL